MGIGSAEGVARIDLGAVRFDGAERPLVEIGGLSASAFRYPSGVAAIRVRNGAGEVVLLPFHGQQIWDATFHGRRLTMGSTFGDPSSSTAYLANYGAFFLHCGALTMGVPAPGEGHPLHGELPHAQYQEAWLSVGRSDAGAVLAMSGTYRHRTAFGAGYDFTPTITVAEGSGRVGLEAEVRNVRSKPMDLMYLAHINFRPVEGAELVDAASDEPDAVRLRRRLPPGLVPDPDYVRFIEEVAASPARHRAIVPGRPIDPELVIGLDCVAGADGWSHALQVLPDGSADFVSHRPGELDHGVRWITRNGDEDALGLMLPATADADGYAAEKAKGNLKQLAPGAAFGFALAFGALTAAEAAAMRARIEAARQRG